MRSQTSLSAEDLATAAGISVARLTDLVELGIVETDSPGSSTFTAAAAARLRRVLRLHAELDLDLADAAIIVDLLQRLDQLEAEVARLRDRPPHGPA